jgi:transcriptional regulator with XRE-family HTH domain
MDQPRTGASADGGTPRPSAGRVCGVRCAVVGNEPGCSACERTFAPALNTPPELPPGFWDTREYQDAFATRKIGRVLQTYRTDARHRAIYGPDGITQSMLGTWLGKTQAQISRIERGASSAHTLDTLIQWAQILRLPQELLWFDLPGQQRPTTTPPQPTQPGRRPATRPGNQRASTKRVAFIQARKAVGLTQEQLAEALHVEPSTIKRWEAGTYSPQPYLRPKLAKILDISRDKLTEFLANPPIASVQEPSQSPSPNAGPVLRNGGMSASADGLSISQDEGFGSEKPWDIDPFECVILNAEPVDFLGRIVVETPVPGRIGWSDVEHVRATTRAVATAENIFGGGLSCEAAIGQLRGPVSCWEHAQITRSVARCWRP